MAAKTFSAGTLQQKTSRSISSLGGSAMQSYGTSMSTADKIVLSSVIGGTAEALGGGKFSNGAVTGAYVMMLNHLGEQLEKNAQLTVSEYEGLSEDEKAKYIEQPLEAVVMEVERTLVSTITPSGTVTVKTQTTTEIWGATAWVKKRYLFRSTTYSIMMRYRIKWITTTQIFYQQFSYSNNWILSNLSWVGSILYPSDEKVISYRNKSEYPGGFLDDYLNFLR